MTRGPALALALALAASGASADEVPAKPAGAIRFATFNAALNEREAGGIVRRLRGGGDAQARLVAEIVQRVRPDVLLLQELDRDPDGESLRLFAAEYLAVGQGGAEAVDYPHTLFPPSNTGVLAGVDLDGDGRIARPKDALGFGWHEGQYAFALLSRFPLRGSATYRLLLWRDLPGHQMPEGVFSAAAEDVLRLSSKTHLAALVAPPGGREIGVIAAHPTPPVFDDPETDVNGRRNADEIALLARLLAPQTTPPSDAGGASTAGATVPAVVMGDLNADPNRGEARPGAVAALLEHPRIVDPVPQSARGDITATFNGGMRVDYVLPTRDLRVVGAGVFWPADDGPLGHLNAASDHRLVWVDVVP